MRSNSSFRRLSHESSTTSGSSDLVAHSINQQDVLPHLSTSLAHQPISQLDHHEQDTQGAPSSPYGLSSPIEESTNLLNQPRTKTRSRALSLGAFSFSANLLPLTQSLEASQQSRREGNKITIISAVGLVVGLQIGSGIFSSPGMLSTSDLFDLHRGSTHLSNNSADVFILYCLT